MRYRWRRDRLWIALLIYWFASVTGASLFVSSGQEWGWIVLLMLVVIATCMITERGQWPWWGRVIWVPASWLLHGLAAIPIGLLALPFFAARPELADRGIAFLTSIPFVVYSMWRSRLFTEAIVTGQAEESPSLIKCTQCGTVNRVDRSQLRQGRQAICGNCKADLEVS